MRWRRWRRWPPWRAPRRIGTGWPTIGAWSRCQCRSRVSTLLAAQLTARELSLTTIRMRRTRRNWGPMAPHALNLTTRLLTSSDKPPSCACLIAMASNDERLWLRLTSKCITFTSGITLKLETLLKIMALLCRCLWRARRRGALRCTLYRPQSLRRWSRGIFCPTSRRTPCA